MAEQPEVPPRRIVVAGASGLLGGRLLPRLRARGHEVVRLVRRPVRTPDEARWDPEHDLLGEGLADVLADADVVVNLAGSPKLRNPGSRHWEEQMRVPRVRTTQVLATAIARLPRPPAMLAANGSSYYGDHGDEPLTEQSTSLGDAPLTRITREWQQAADPARQAGARVCVLRTAPVIDRANPPLQLQLPLFRLGLGGRIGDGQQNFPLISMRDWVGATTHLAEHPTAEGPFNLCCPQTPTNAEYTRALAAAVGRPARIPVPRAVVARVAGALAPELLGSVRLQPAALVDCGYVFADNDVRDVVTAALAH